VDQEYITELEEKVNQQSFEIKDLRQRLMEEKENFDQQKIKFQTMLALQTNEMKKVQKELEREKERVVEEKMKPVIDTESREKLQALTNKYKIERGEYENKINNLKDELNKEKKNRDVITKLKSELEEVQAECEMKKIENKAMKDQVSKLDKDLAKAKIDLKDSKLNDRFFQVERIKDGIVKNKKVMTVIFRLIKGSKTEKGRCECVFKRQKHGGTSKEDVVNLLDFNTFKINDKKKDYFDVSFMVS
jgi:chromosome segregation ATPase